MPKKLVIMFALLLSLVSQAAFAAGVSETSSQRRGQLYRITHEGKVSYLFGTIHVGKDGFYPLDAEASRALLDSNTLVLELDIRQDLPFQKALARHGRYPDGDIVQNHLSPATLNNMVAA